MTILVVLCLMAVVAGVFALFLDRSFAWGLLFPVLILAGGIALVILGLSMDGSELARDIPTGKGFRFGVGILTGARGITRILEVERNRKVAARTVPGD